MIVPIGAGKYSRDEYIVCPRAPISPVELRERMISRSKVSPGSYAYSLVDNLYAAIFLQSLDLKADYEKYFAREYGSFRGYLRRRLRFDRKVIARLSCAFKESSGMYYFQPSHAFLTEEYGLDFLTRLIEDSSTKATL